MKNVKSNVYIKQYKNYFYTIKRLYNTKYGHPNFEVIIFKNVNRRFDVLGETFHISTYNDVTKEVENYIDKMEV